MIVELFSIIAPVFIGAAIGFVWARMGRPYDADLITTLVTNIGFPCLVFVTLVDVDLDLGTFRTMAMATMAVLLAFAVIAGAVVRMAGLEIRTFAPPVVFANTANMGLPLCLLAFGDQGLALAIAYFSVVVVVQFTIGVGVVSGATSVAEIARIPIIYAVAAALAFMVSGAQPPDWLISTTRLLGGMSIPLMLITLGISLARIKVASFRRSLALSVLRLVMGFAVGVGVAAAFGLEGAARGVVILESAMPVAAINYLFAQRYDRAPEEVAGMVLISTAISFATLPALLWFVL